jgi:hypothetical protein
MGWMIPLLVLLPNALLVRFPPKERPAEASGVSLGLQVAERLGQAGVFVIPFFYRPHFGGTPSAVSVAVMAIALVGYYLGWLRYALRGQRYALLFAPLWSIPLPLAVLPVVYFGAASALVRSWYLGLATLVFAIGHLAVSEHERRTIATAREE